MFLAIRYIRWNDKGIMNQYKKIFTHKQCPTNSVTGEAVNGIEINASLCEKI